MEIPHTQKASFKSSEYEKAYKVRDFYEIEPLLSN